MRLSEILNEEKQQTVGIIFGRFNPPHKGHKAAWEMASENDHWYVGTNQSTQGPKDPLPYEIKIAAMEAIMPEVKGHIVPSKTWFTLADEVYKKHGGGVLYIYTDEDWVIKKLEAYNGKERNDGMYSFDKIIPVSTPRLSSATAVRQAVADNDRKAFQNAAGVSPSTKVAGKPFFSLVKKYLDQYQK